MAAKAGDISELTRLLRDGIGVDACSRNNWTPLILASQAGHLDAVVFLLEHGANVNARNARGKSAIDYADDGKMIALLLAYGASYEPVISNEWLIKRISIKHADTLYGDTVAWQHFKSLVQPGEELWLWGTPYRRMGSAGGLVIVRDGIPVRVGVTFVS
jgi:hypothetical protein